jgi:hypothetical protein
MGLDGYKDFPLDFIMKLERAFPIHYRRQNLNCSGSQDQGACAMINRFINTPSYRTRPQTPEAIMATEGSTSTEGLAIAVLPLLIEIWRADI